MEALKFVAPTGSADLSFWEKLYELKLNKYRISAEDKQIKSFVVDHSEIVLTENSFLEDDNERFGDNIMFLIAAKYGAVAAQEPYVHMATANCAM